MSTTDKSLLQTILSLLDVLSSHKTEGQSWIHLLSLLCIFTILNQPHQSTANTPSAQPTNPLQKLLGDLSKGASQGGGLGGADTLLSLLPLLNNPQIKSKLNPTNIAAMMNVVQNLTNGTSSPPTKSTAPTPDVQTAPTVVAPTQTPPAPPLTSPEPTPPMPKSTPAPTNRYLDWKSSF